MLIEGLLINILVILTPVLLWQLFMLDRFYEKYAFLSKWRFGILTGIACILCMSFPVYLGDYGEKFQWDMRWLPFVLALLYGGYRGGLIAMLLLLGYRWYIGGGIAYFLVIVVCLILYLAVPLLKPWFQKRSMVQKIFTGIGLSCVTHLLVYCAIIFYLYLIDKVYVLEHRGIWLFFLMTVTSCLAMAAAVWLLENILENHRIRVRLIESEQRYRALVEESPESIFITKKGMIVYINETGKKLLGVKQGTTIVGRQITDFIHPDYHHLAAKQLISVQHGTADEIVEGMFISLLGEILHVQVKAIPTIYQGEPAEHIVVRDITELMKSREYMQQSEKLNIVGELAAGIAHEIRNPLTSLRGFVQLFQHMSAHSEDAYLNIMLAEIDRINTIVGELLLLAKPKQMDFEHKNLLSILEDVIALIQPQAHLYNVQIITRFDNTIPFIYCAENKLKQVFINILKNAIEATETGEEVLIQVKLLTNKVSICFIDKGCGIPEDHLAKIGQAFFTTKEKGTGLGMMISFSIIDSHHGQMIINSKEQKGTTVEIILPVANEMTTAYPPGFSAADEAN